MDIILKVEEERDGVRDRVHECGCECGMRGNLEGRQNGSKHLRVLLTQVLKQNHSKLVKQLILTAHFLKHSDQSDGGK